MEVKRILLCFIASQQFRFSSSLIFLADSIFESSNDLFDTPETYENFRYDLAYPLFLSKIYISSLTSFSKNFLNSSLICTEKVTHPYIIYFFSISFTMESIAKCLIWLFTQKEESVLSYKND